MARQPAAGLEYETGATIIQRFSGQLHRVTCLVCLSLALSIALQGQVTAPLPSEAQEALHKGILAANQQDYLMAIRFFENARKMAPRAPEIYYNLGLAESKIPGRELRAICWFEAFLAANPNAPNAAAVNDQVDVLGVKSLSSIRRLIVSTQEAAIRVSVDNPIWRNSDLVLVVTLWSRVRDRAAALKAADLIPLNSGRDRKSTRLN